MKCLRNGRFVDKLQAADFGAALPDFENHFDHVVNVALRIDPSRDEST